VQASPCDVCGGDAITGSPHMRIIMLYE
jgi:hypothetical protein